MHRYIPNTGETRNEMLQSIGLKNIDELFKDIPEEIKLKSVLDINPSMSEQELERHMREISGKNLDMKQGICFLGAGCYDHYVPTVIKHILSRQEFYTSYTPYQPEISQGTLQAIFEYQSMICELTGMDVSNASMYDGATAAAEAAMMACHASGKDGIIVSKTVNPFYREVLSTYSKFSGFRIKEAEFRQGLICLEDLEKLIDSDTSAVIVQNPNFFGIIENMNEIAALLKSRGILLIAVVDPVSLAVLKPPSEYGADIAAGEGQPLGNSMGFGGPHFGFLACTEKLVRKMPGRIVGQTHDKNGKRGFVLTLQAREQHIRRGKANSNICSNHSLNAVAAAIYMSVMGRDGLREAAEQCINKACYTFEKLTHDGTVKPVFKAPFFREFAVSLPVEPTKLNRELLKHGIAGGLDLTALYPEIERGWLVAVTENRTRNEMDFFARISLSHAKELLND